MAVPTAASSCARRPPPSSRGQAADHHGGPGGQRRPQPQAGQRYAEQLQRDPRQQRCQHRLIDVAGLQVPGGVQEVQFVAVEPVPRRHHHEHGGHDAADPDHPPVERRRPATGSAASAPVPDPAPGSADRPSRRTDHRAIAAAPFPRTIYAPPYDRRPARARALWSRKHQAVRTRSTGLTAAAETWFGPLRGRHAARRPRLSRSAGRLARYQQVICFVTN